MNQAVIKSTLKIIRLLENRFPKNNQLQIKLGTVLIFRLQISVPVKLLYLETSQISMM